MFTLDTDSLKTLGFNPRTPTLRLRPMTSRLYEYRRAVHFCSSASKFPFAACKSRAPSLDFSLDSKSTSSSSPAYLVYLKARESCERRHLDRSKIKIECNEKTRGCRAHTCNEITNIVPAERVLVHKHKTGNTVSRRRNPVFQVIESRSNQPASNGPASRQAGGQPSR